MKSHLVLKTDGSLIKDAKPRMDLEFLLEAPLSMLMSRIFDERTTALLRQGRTGVFSLSLRQESSMIGSATTLDPTCVPQYQELMAVVHHSYPLERFADPNMGRCSEATRIPDGVNILPTQVAFAAQLPNAAGLGVGA